MMTFYYTSCWKSSDAHTFVLRGVISASPHDIGAYFPEDPEEQEEWNRLRRNWDLVGSLAPLDWLYEIARGGNGITDEYDEVRELEASDLEAALHNAYGRTLGEYGRQISMYERTADGEVQDLGDPFAELFHRRADDQSEQWR
jgi:hypothetical protein